MKNYFNLKSVSHKYQKSLDTIINGDTYVSKTKDATGCCQIVLGPRLPPPRFCVDICIAPRWKIYVDKNVIAFAFDLSLGTSRNVMIFFSHM